MTFAAWKEVSPTLSSINVKPIIRIEKLSKRYRLGARQAPYDTLRDKVAKSLSAPFRRLRNAKESNDILWALRGISFDVAAGEVCGIIGSNGAGKSTLLKILSRITEPTTGQVELYGRTGSLLEVGTGFHPELTGRENIYLNGSILGMKRVEIMSKFDEIVAFSEISRFIDTPVKHYSSGMYTRLAFAVAAHLEPEILIVDEVLAVGDVTFQKKCLGKMGEVAQGGRTVIFVSHNMLAIKGLCSHVVWLHQGEIRDEGEPNGVVSKYLRTSDSMNAEQIWPDIASAPGNSKFRLTAARVRPSEGVPSDRIDVHTPTVMEFEYWNLVPGARLNLSVVVKTAEGYPIFNSGSGWEQNWGGKPYPEGLFRSAFHIPADLLNDGTHRVHLYIVKDQSEVIFQLEDVLVFDVQDAPDLRGAWFGKWTGAIRPNLIWETELLREGLR